MKLTEQLVRSGSPGMTMWAWAETVSPGEVPRAVDFLPGTAFSCQATGACCHRFLLGPLTTAEHNEHVHVDHGPSLVAG